MIEPLVLVRWRDAWFDFEAGSGGWPDEYIVQTVGYLVRDTDIVSVAQEALPTGDWRADLRLIAYETQRSMPAFGWPLTQRGRAGQGCFDTCSAGMGLRGGFTRRCVLS